MTDINSTHNSINSNSLKIDQRVTDGKLFDFSHHKTELAAILIKDAAVGRMTNFNRSSGSLLFYKVYLSWLFRLVRFLIHTILFVLLFIDVGNRDRTSIKAVVTVSIEGICMVFYLLQLFIVYKYSLRKRFFEDKKHYTLAASVLMTYVDIVLFMSGVYRIRISPMLRPLIFINSEEQSQIRRHLRTLRITLIKTFLICPFLLTFYFMMVAFVYRYFKIRRSETVFYYDSRPYMQNFLDIIWETIVYVTSANSPDVMLPAFASSELAGILFLVFYAMFFFLLVFVSGLIMGYYREHAKEEMQGLVLSKLCLVNDAFSLLSETKEIEKTSVCESHLSTKENVVTKEKWKRVMSYFTKFGDCNEAADILLYVLTGSNKAYIRKDEFIKVGDLFSIPLNQVSGSLNFFERHLWFGFSNSLANFVENKFFNIFVGAVIIVNSICITFSNESYTELFFTLIFVLEIFLRIYVKGVRRYFSGLWNVFDFLIIVLAFIFWFIENAKIDIKTITFTLLVLRNLRLLKLLRGVALYHKLLHILGMLIPTMSSLILIIFCSIAIYTCIGNCIYHGLLYTDHSLEAYMVNTTNCNATALSDSDFGRFHYCILSFNSFVSGFVTLCSISIGNNWHVITEGYEKASGHIFISRIYFAVFKGVMTYLLLLVVAFVLDIFLLAYNQKGVLDIEAIVTKRLTELNKNFISYRHMRESRDCFVNTNTGSDFINLFKRKRLRECYKSWFQLKSKGARSVEYISQAMFQTEIENELRQNKNYKHLFSSDFP